MFCCKKRKARKAAKAQAVVSSLAAVESALEGKTAEMFAEKLTGNKKALKKARKATAKTVRAAEKELARIERNGGKRPRKGLAFLGLLLLWVLQVPQPTTQLVPWRTPGRTPKRGPLFFVSMRSEAPLAA